MIAQANSRYIPLADESVHCCVTSIPYWGLRDYGLEPQIWGGRADCSHEWGPENILTRDRQHLKELGERLGCLGGNKHSESADKYNASTGQFCTHCNAWRGSLGLEPTLDLFIANIVAVFREVWRVLRPDGQLWLNVGDTFATASNGRSAAATKAAGDDRTFRDKPFSTVGNGLKAKDLCMVPARVALALQQDGWYLRSEIVWAKKNPMPESVTDRPTKAHEMVYLLTKRERYYYDSEAVRQPVAESTIGRGPVDFGGAKGRNYNPDKNDPNYRNGKEQWGRTYDYTESSERGRNLRSVWTIATEPYPAAHYATFPTKLVEPCILAGTSARGCCPKCGAGWVQVVEKRFDHEPESYHGSHFNSGKTAIHQENRAQNGTRGYSITTGWRPSCSCYRTKNKTKRQRQNLTGSWLERVANNKTAPTVPAVILDPFCGSGTTGYVAHQLRRRFVGLDLSPVYLAENALPRAEGKTSQKAIEELPLFRPEAQ